MRRNRIKIKAETTINLGCKMQKTNRVLFKKIKEEKMMGKEKDLLIMYMVTVELGLIKI